MSKDHVGPNMEALASEHTHLEEYWWMCWLFEGTGTQKLKLPSELEETDQ
uniref:Hypothetical DUF1212-domain-containing protein n=1 Tax=Moniliophthora roreri TaxID=221103 RepID=A0A0W0G804_MONRR